MIGAQLFEGSKTQLVRRQRLRRRKHREHQIQIRRQLLIPGRCDARKPHHWNSVLGSGSCRAPSM